MRLGLKYISKENRELLADVFNGNVSAFLNGVDLSTSKGKQAYIDAIIAGKNPFKKEEINKGEDGSSFNNNLTVTASWANIVRHADSEMAAPAKANNISLSSPFDNNLLNIAYRKKLEELQMDTALATEDISKKLLQEYSNNASEHHSILNAVKFFHAFSADIFTECDSCGNENDFGWEFCNKCGYKNEL